MKLTQEQIDTAAKWWSEVIKNPKFDALGKYDSSENRPMVLSQIIAKATSLQNPLPQENINRFENELRKTLEEQDIPSNIFFIDVDYDPCQLLYNAAINAGFTQQQIGLKMFPWKTHMVFKDGKVMVSYGYCAEYKEI